MKLRLWIPRASTGLSERSRRRILVRAAVPGTGIKQTSAERFIIRRMGRHAAEFAESIRAARFPLSGNEKTRVVERLAADGRKGLIHDSTGLLRHLPVRTAGPDHRPRTAAPPSREGRPVHSRR